MEERPRATKLGHYLALAMVAGCLLACYNEGVRMASDGRVNARSIGTIFLVLVLLFSNIEDAFFWSAPPSPRRNVVWGLMTIAAAIACIAAQCVVYRNFSNFGEVR